MLEFAACSSIGDFCRGAFGIAEPNRETCPPYTGFPDLLVVPAVGMDKEMVRLGYGGGYYDRLRACPGWDNIPAVGLIFSFQLVEALPREAWDRPLDGVATEKDFLWRSR